VRRGRQAPETPRKHFSTVGRCLRGFAGELRVSRVDDRNIRDVLRKRAGGASTRSPAPAVALPKTALASAAKWLIWPSPPYGQDQPTQSQLSLPLAGKAAQSVGKEPG
jgi:hypothetical protein